VVKGLGEKKGDRDREQPEVKVVVKTRDEEMRRLKVTLNDLFTNVTYHGWITSIQLTS
jgi:hypothetical protein